MSRFEHYGHCFECVRMERRNGVLEMVLHSDGGPLQWNDTIHTELPEAFYAVGQDVENKVVILTGTGDGFIPAIDSGSFHFDPSTPPVALDRIYREGKALIQNLLNISVPMIAAVNGPARVHAELALFCDIVLASEHAEFQDSHMQWGIVPGDGTHIAFPMAFGVNRGRFLSLTSAVVTAQQALEWGGVVEVLPPEKVRARAWEIAESLAQKPLLALRYAREALTVEIQRQIRAHLSLGLALEGFSSGYGSWGSTLHE